MNPGCKLPQCNTTDSPALFYASQFINDDTIHMLYSSFDQLTINIIQTKKGYGPAINYTSLFNKSYSNAISFGDTKPSNSFSLILRRLIQFNDANDSGRLNQNDTTVKSFWLNNLKPNLTSQDRNTDQPRFQIPLENVCMFFFSLEQK